MLIGPEVRHLRRDLRRPVTPLERAREIGGGDARVLARGRPVLDPDRAEEGVIPAHDVARRVDVFAGAQGLVGDDAVGDAQAAVVEPRGGGRGADADDDHVGRQALAAGELDPDDAPVDRLEAGDADAAADGHAVARVQLGEPVADRAGEDARERRLGDLEHRRGHAEGGRRRRDLEPDETGADHDDVTRGDELAAQPRRVVERAQHVDAGGVGLGGQPAAADPVARIRPS